MRIGELARQTGCQVETIRYYEKVGILPRPLRAHNNYRNWRQADCRRLKFVLRCRALGFSLNEVRTLLELIDGGHYNCVDVEAIGHRHLDDVRTRIADLQQLESSLVDLVSNCHGGKTPDCSFLEALFEDSEQQVVQE
ncbi:MAG: helix-turn-helix domain-containing protein [Wenzhouxiangellaceae bacterium]|nr:helix-turn-helix domain-containing protein [Wenzhouxiangellaceae bacterium]